MTTLNLDFLSIAPASDPSDVTLIGHEAQSTIESSPIEVRRYANGVRRAVSSPGKDVDVTVTLNYITRSEYQSLLDFVGTLVIVRDTRQRVIYGIVQSVDGAEVVGADLVIANFTVQQVTFSEEV